MYVRINVCMYVMAEGVSFIIVPQYVRIVLPEGEANVGHESSLDEDTIDVAGR